MKTFKVTPQETGQTLLSFLREKSIAPSVKKLKKAIESRYCKINGQVETFSTHPVEKDDLVLFDERAFQEASPKKEMTVLFEDDELLICDKPAGVLSDSNVHRLDKETSGILVFAKTEAMKEAMQDLFRNKQIKKEYLAFVDGKVLKDEGKRESFLAPKGRYQGQTIYGSSSKGKWAVTHFRCLKRGEKASLLLLTPETGRTHQLRIHMSEMGHPILGDHQYGKTFRFAQTFRRHLLHAHTLSFIHPTKREEIKVTSPLPQDMVLHNLQFFISAEI